MVVDAQVHMAAVTGHIPLFSKQLHAGHIHSHHQLRLELPLEDLGRRIAIPGGQLVRAEHCRPFAQLEQAMVQRTGTAHGISIRVFVAEDQNFIRSQ